MLSLPRSSRKGCIACELRDLAITPIRAAPEPQHKKNLVIDDPWRVVVVSYAVYLRLLLLFRPVARTALSKLSWPGQVAENVLLKISFATVYHWARTMSCLFLMPSCFYLKSIMNFPPRHGCAHSLNGKDQQG